MLAKLLDFPLGAASLRLSRAAVLRPAPFCLLSSPFPAVGVGGFFEAARPCLCLSHRHRFFALSLRSGSSPSLLFVGVFGHLLLCVFSFSAMGVSGLVEVCSPFGPLFSPACLAMLGLFWCFESFWYFCWAPLLRAQPARRFFALPPTPCCLLPTALRPLLPTSHQLCLGSWLCLCSCWRFCWAPLLHGLFPRLFFALPVFSAYLG